MRTLIHIAVKTLVRVFYLEHATLFLFVVGIAAGFMRSIEHIALAEFFVSQWYLVCIPFFIWVLYALKISNFNSTALRKPENSFFFQLIFLPGKTQLLIICVVVILQFCPAWLYGVFLMGTAVKFNAYDSLVMVIGSLLSLSVALVFQLRHVVQHPDRDKTTSRLLQKINQLIIRPYPLFAIEWLVRKKTVTVLITKAFNVALLFAIAALYTTDDYDFRLLGMALIVIAGSTAQVVHEIHRFENYHFTITRQLPLKLMQRCLYILTTLGLLMLPEMGMVITHFPSSLNAWELVQAIGFLFTALFFWSGLLYRKGFDPETFTKMIFGCTMMAIVLCLFRIPVWGISIAALSVSLFWYKKYYYQFEYPPA